MLSGCILLGVEMEVLVWVQWNITILIQTSGACVHRCVRGEGVLEWPPAMVSSMQWVVMMLLPQTTVPGSWTMWKGETQGHWRKANMSPRINFITSFPLLLLSLSPSVPYFPHSFLYISFYSILTLFNFILHNSFFPSA